MLFINTHLTNKFRIRRKVTMAINENVPNIAGMISGIIRLKGLLFKPDRRREYWLVDLLQLRQSDMFIDLFHL